MLELLFCLRERLVPCLHDEVMVVARCFGKASQGGGDQVVDISGLFIAHDVSGVEGIKRRDIRQAGIALAVVMDMVAEVLYAVGKGEEGSFEEGIIMGYLSEGGSVDRLMGSLALYQHKRFALLVIEDEHINPSLADVVL